MNYDPTGCVTVDYCSECSLKRKVADLECENETLRKEAQVYAGFKHGRFYNIRAKGKDYLYVDRDTEIIFNWPGGVNYKNNPCVGIGTAGMIESDTLDEDTIEL